MTPAILIVFENFFFCFLDAFREKKNIHVSKLNVNQKEFGTRNGSNIKVVCGRIFTMNSSTNISAVFLGDESITLENLVLSLPGL